MWKALFTLILLTPVVAGQAIPHQVNLNECLERALANHPLAAASQARRLGAQEARRDAGLRPNPTLTIQTENWRLTGSPPFAAGSDLDLFIYGTQMFETAGKATRRVELAESGVELAEAEIKAVRWRIQREVARSFYHALTAQASFEIAGENRANLEQLVGYTALRVREGFSPEADLIRTRLEHQTLLIAEAAAAQELERAKLELLRAMSERRFELDFRLVAPDAGTSSLPPLDQIDREAIEGRPELLALRGKLAQARAAWRLAQAETRPNWELSFGYKRTNNYNTMIANVSVPLPIFNRRQGAVGRAAAEIAAVEQEVAATESYIRAEVATAYRAAVQLTQRIEVMQQQYLRDADESRDIALVAYREGVNDLYKLLDTQRARNEARLLFSRAKYELQWSLAELTLAAGKELSR